MAKRGYGTGHLYQKHGSYYGRWRTLDGRLVNRLIGPIRPPGARSGLTLVQAERLFRQLQDQEEKAPRRRTDVSLPTVDEVADSLRQELRLKGSRRSYLEGCESMQRVHISPRLGARSVDEITTRDIDRLAAVMLENGLAPKTVRNVLAFLHATFEHALDRGHVGENPVRRAKRPGRRRRGDRNPDLQFLAVAQLDAVIRALPDEMVVRRPAPARCGRKGPAPPPPPDVWASAARPHPHRSHHRASPVGAARLALARRRLDGPADPGAERLCQGRALRRWQVRALDP